MEIFYDLLFGEYLVFLIFLLLGLVEFLILFILAQVRKKKIKTWTATKAVVADVISKRSSKGGTVYRPVFDFTTASGEKITHQSKLGSRTHYYSKGMEVDLVYNPVHPNRYVVRGDKRLQFIFTVVSLAALIFVIIGLGGIVQLILNYIKISKA